MKRKQLGETRIRRKEARNERRTVKDRIRLKHLRGGYGEDAYVKFCEQSKNPNNGLARNPRKRAEV